MLKGRLDATSCGNKTDCIPPAFLRVQSPPHEPVFTEQVNGSEEFLRLRKAHPRAFQITDRPSMTISHEPWGEATLNIPAYVHADSNRAISFVTSDVALVQGFFTFKDNDGVRQPKALLFVLKKEENGWKIASIRVLAVM
jgi:hypothetical protein